MNIITDGSFAALVKSVKWIYWTVCVCVHLFELWPGEEAVLVGVPPPEGGLHPVQLHLAPPRLLHTGAPASGGQAAQQTVLGTQVRDYNQLDGYFPNHKTDHMYIQG